MIQYARRRAVGAQHGFSMVELLVVIGIIGIMAALMIPAMANYLRLYTVRGAVAQVAGEIQTARTQAIKRNVNNGVVFTALSATTYQVFGEDAPALTNAPSTLAPAQRRNLAQAIQDGLAGPVRTLPQGYRFRAGGTVTGFCFDRLGMRWNFGSTQCPTVPDVPTADFFGACDALLFPGCGANDVQLTIEKSNNTSINRALLVGSGGRTTVQ